MTDLDKATRDLRRGLLLLEEDIIEYVEESKRTFECLESILINNRARIENFYKHEDETNEKRD